jgi:hypothetical protein
MHLFAWVFGDEGYAFVDVLEAVSVSMCFEKGG